MACNTLGAESAQVIPFPVRKRDLNREFMAALLDCELARAEYELVGKQCEVARFNGERTASGPWRDARDEALFKLQHRALALAMTPAPFRRQLDYKRAAIGRIWLCAEGEFYDALRAGLKLDVDRLEIGMARRRGKGPVVN